jgi:outer membrane cobalamin receptor
MKRELRCNSGTVPAAVSSVENLYTTNRRQPVGKEQAGGASQKTCQRLNPKCAFRELKAGMMKNALILWFCVLGTLLVAQQQDSLLQEVMVVDTRYDWLREVQFSVNPDSISRQNQHGASLAEWLPAESSVHVRQYAPGMVATYSTHGATSAQNAILWGGITINNPALGASDLALMPASLFTPEMLRGGSAALFGTGAMGSIINLQRPLVPKGWHVQLGQSFGSFQTLTGHGKLSFRNKRITSVTDVAYSASQNNYTYRNPYKAENPLETRMHAAFQTLHLQQTLQVAINKYQYVDAAIWYNQAERETPNSIIVGADGSAVLYDRALRSRIGWHANKNKHQVDVVYAYLNEWQRFSDPQLIIDGQATDDTNTNSSHVLRADWLYTINKSWQWQSGVQSRFDNADGSNRGGEQRTTSLQTGIKYSGRLFQAQTVLRLEEWDGSLLPLSPFGSIAIPLPVGFSVTAFGGFNYRIPSMNDRFWNPGGNLDLKPEQGWSYETAISNAQAIGRWDINVRLAYYHSIVNNYILWVPENNMWSPHNVRKVAMNGVDLDLKAEWKRNKHILRLHAAWAYNQSIVRASHNENDNSVGRQLTYQPQNKITGSITYLLAKWSATFTGIRVGEVSTNYSATGHPLAAYTLLNAGLGYAFAIRKSALSLRFFANNLANIYYENIAFYPMPGRNYSIKFTFAL